MMPEQPKEFTFGYFSRNKYQDLVFYVKTGEHSNDGLFEMPDTPENRALMDALIPHTEGCIPPEEAAKRNFPTPLCRKCPIYLVGRGCIHELAYESSGVCDAGITVIAQAAREKVLKDVTHGIDEVMLLHGIGHATLHKELWKVIENLRQHKGEP
jgi:hypothetical protein